MVYKDLAYGIVLTAPSPATSGTSLVLNSGQGTYFPQPSTDGNFYITVFPISADPTFTTAEICLVTARSSDTLTIVRTQKGTSARTILVGDRVIQGIYASDIVGVNPAVAVQVATTAAGDTSSLTYNNGVAGVGATLTGSVNTALTFDGQTLTSVGQRVLVKNDTQSPSGAFNGVYTLTQVQTVALAPILTRATDYNVVTDINNTGAIPVVLGTANAQTTWVLTSTVTAIGTDALTFTQFSLKPSTIVTLSGSQALTNKTYEGYSINATPTANNIPVLDANHFLPQAALPTGSVLQVVNVSYNTTVNSSSSVYADTGLTATITPKYSNSKILVIVNQNGLRKDTGNAYGLLKLLRGATDLIVFAAAFAYTSSTAANNVGGAGTTYLDSPATTSATTYKTQFASVGSVAQVGVQANGEYSTITLMEIAG